MQPQLASWMTPVDRDILEQLKNDDCGELVLTPRVISANLDWGRQTVRDHLMALRSHGLVEYYDEDAALHQLSDKGRAWLRGDLPTDDLEDE
ncbi:ArsR family transcriptional regulator [Halarchaeum sp. P4]|uniref:ArsR family transcriptional regulator n=1 Tax=Halarchaeum sp. P4 TaxID=3421639 RepID=UPI003EBCC737